MLETKISVNASENLIISPCVIFPKVGGFGDGEGWGLELIKNYVPRHF